MNQTSNLCQTDFTGSFAEFFSESSFLSNSQFVIPNSQFSNAYGFTGRYLDSETGLWYFRARYFDNELGRFISRDPLGFVDGPVLDETIPPPLSKFQFSKFKIRKVVEVKWENSIKQFS